MPMTLRTLKKRSKQARPILEKHFPESLIGEQFMAERGASYHGLVIRCTHGSGDPCLVEGRPRCECTYHPLKGTPMIGGMSGYYEPEWSEQTLYEVLSGVLHWSDKPEPMTDAEWARALRIVGLTPAKHAAFTEAFEREASGECADPLSPAPVNPPAKD